MKILIALLIGTGIVAITIAISTDTKAENQERALPKKEFKQPEHTPYAFLFRHVNKLNSKKSEIKDLKGKSGLSDADFAHLVSVAKSYQKEVASYDAQARVIIDEFHRVYPPGRLPRGTGPGRAPEALINLQTQRDGAALRYRDQLKTEIDGAQLERFVDAEITSNVKGGR